MSASPIQQVNGTKPATMPVFGPFHPLGSTWPAPTDGIEAPAVEAAPFGVVESPASVALADLIAEVEVEAIRARTASETEARRIVAEAEAEAVRIKAAEEAERQRLANERARMALEEKRAAHEEKMAEAQARQDEIKRQAAAARARADAQQKADAKQGAEVATVDERWRKYAIRFAWVCGVVALPVQMSAFWNPEAPWMVAAPLMLEAGAWVVHRGAAAAVANRRLVWHYRTIVWLLAFVAAGINLYHGLLAFDAGTAIGTAFASIAGPGVWDLHEHGRIRVRDGVLSRKARRAKKASDKRATAEKAAAVRFEAEKQAYIEKGVRDAAARLAADRAAKYPQVWEHALKLAAALGETTVTEAVWVRAYNDIEGTDLGDGVDVIRTRNVAARRVAAARSEAPGNTPVKIMSSQVVQQVPTRSRRGHAGGPKVRGVRRTGDTEKFANGARKQASIAAKNATTDPSS